MASGKGQRISAAEHLQEARHHLAGKNPRAAYELLKTAVVQFDNDPLLLSYYGYLKAEIDGAYHGGIEDCSRALLLYQRLILRSGIIGDETLKAVLFLNLGRAYRAAGMRKDAYDTLTKAMLLDLQNGDILAEFGCMGVRKRRPIPFLSRSNPINNFIGKMMRKPAMPLPPRHD
ncbi:MAG TPA: hypothetical protein VK654_05385 [Nitrospirota bacterium]|nr:hypothetical protein [Nitrospirota bacterium]